MNLQYIILGATVRLLSQFSPERSSDVCGFIARAIGPLLPVSRIAASNLKMAFPGLTDACHRTILRESWDNLGRVVGEFPHLSKLDRTPDGPGWEIFGAEHIETGFHGGRPPLFFSAHIGNWEMILPVASALSLPIAGIYRKASNQVVAALVQEMRFLAAPGVKMFPKGSHGAKAIIGHLASGGSIGLLVDQKMNDGISVQFFGRAAWTAPAIARLALRFERDIVPVRVRRVGPARFRLICDAPLRITRTGDRRADEISIMSTINRHIESWICEEPSSWLWFHRRWPKVRA
ncbi:LpxL/LpxP family acyltransferase [Acidomonas methanolica]|uniref:LpxL/LpxP family acyltransferase n=1 Tax=Acidomonas methanolica TaxID=437 RepID=UPI00211A0711|nr:lauroyl acyltransferase [Acidomonas methanolica]